MHGNKQTRYFVSNAKVNPTPTTQDQFVESQRFRNPKRTAAATTVTMATTARINDTRRKPDLLFEPLEQQAPTTSQQLFARTAPTKKMILEPSLPELVSPPLTHRDFMNSRTANGLNSINTDALHGILNRDPMIPQKGADDNQKKKKEKKIGGRHSLAPLPSAELNPIDTAALASRMQLQIWASAFQEELCHFRSPAVAADLLLERCKQVCADLPSPHLLMTASALLVFRELASGTVAATPSAPGHNSSIHKSSNNINPNSLPKLTLSALASQPAFREAAPLALGLLDELCEAVYITPPNRAGGRTAAGGSLQGLAAIAAGFGRPTYFDAYRNIAQSYYTQRSKSEKYETMMQRGGRVLDRAIGQYQKAYVKRLLQRWYTFAQRMKSLKDKYKRLFGKCSTAAAVSKVISSWRQYSHRIHVSLLKRSTKQNVEQLHDAHVAFRQVEDQLKATQHEAARKDRELAETLGRVETLHGKQAALRSSIAVAHAHYVAARKLWVNAVAKLFGDVPVNMSSVMIPEDGNVMTWIKDFLAEYGGIELEPMVNKLSKKSKFTPAILHEVVKLLCESCARRRGFSIKWPFSVVSSGADGVKQPSMPQLNLNFSTLSLIDQGQRIMGFFKFLSHDLDPMLETADVVRGDQTRMKRFVSILAELYGGGCLSLFFSAPHSSLSSMNQSVSAILPVVNDGVQYQPFQSRMQVDPRQGAVADRHEVEDMLADWHAGMARVKHGRYYIQGPALMEDSVREMLSFDDSTPFFREVQHLFDISVTTTTTSEGVERSVIEPAVQAALPSIHRVQRLWPSKNGDSTDSNSGADTLRTVQELAQYITAIGEVFVQLDRTAVAAAVSHHLATGSTLSYPIALASDDVQAVLKMFHSELRHAWEITTSAVWAKKIPLGSSSENGRFNKEAAVKLMEFVQNNVQLLFSNEELLAVYPDAVKAHPAKTLQTMVLLLCAWSEFFDPNPYTPVDVKLRVFFRTLFHST